MLLLLACLTEPAPKNNTTPVADCIPTGTVEICNGEDDDCDGQIDINAVDATQFFSDLDQDGFGDPNDPQWACQQPDQSVSNADDCDPQNSASYPGATEFCNGYDDNCDGQTDEATAEDAIQWYADTDADGFGDAQNSQWACETPAGFVTDATDCNDQEAAISPAASEICDPQNTDENCNNRADDSDPSVDPTGTLPWYQDTDGDGYGSPEHIAQTCHRPDGYTDRAQDCDDQNVLINPDMLEACNGIDEDCDGQIDEDAFDARAWYMDADQDGYGDLNTAIMACEALAGFIAQAGDCNDQAIDISPEATEICDAQSTDENCNGLSDDQDPSTDPTTYTTTYQDNDGDGDGDLQISFQACIPPANTVANANDCNDNAANISTSATEICDPQDTDEDCDGLSDDADPSLDTTTASIWYADSDADGYAGASSILRCEQPAHYLSSSSDCDDADSATHPGASEVCNGNDDDCNGTLDPSTASNCPNPSSLSLTEGDGLYPISASNYVLMDENEWATSSAIINALAAHLTTVSVGDVLADVNRDGDPISSADLPRATGLARGFVWNSGDVAVDYWLPQGITGSFDADPSGVVDGYESVLVSWHYDPAAAGTTYDKGVRISFADVSGTTDIDYRHVLLVKPTGSSSHPDFETVEIHAGGIAWVGDYLYVADTDYGLRVFDMNHIMQVATDQDTMGCDSNVNCRAYTYKYVLPQVTRYALPNCGCDLTFSFVSLDSSSDSLITGAYSSSSIDEVLVRWPLDPTTHLLSGGDYTTATEAWIGQQDRMQGAAAYGSEFWLSCSSQSGAYGKLYNVSTSASTGYTWVDGPEDLAIDPNNGWIWSLTEDPGDRWVFAVDQNRVGG